MPAVLPAQVISAQVHLKLCIRRGLGCPSSQVHRSQCRGDTKMGTEDGTLAVGAGCGVDLPGVEAWAEDGSIFCGE